MKRRDVLKYLALSGAVLSTEGCIESLLAYKRGEGLLYEVETKKLTYIANEPQRFPVPTVIVDNVSYEFDILSIMVDKPRGAKTIKLAVKGPTDLKEAIGKQIKFTYLPETRTHVKTKVEGFLPVIPDKITKDKREIDFIDEGIEIDGVLQWCKIKHG